MSINVECDDCRDDVLSGGSIYCAACYGKLENRITELENDVGSKEKEISSYERDMARLEDERESLKDRVNELIDERTTRGGNS